MSKVFKITELNLESEQDIKIYPTPEFDGINIEYKEAALRYNNQPLYLDKTSMEALISEMRNMMNYVNGPAKVIDIENGKG
jgi:hypothetical protein